MIVIKIREITGIKIRDAQNVTCTAENIEYNKILKMQKIYKDILPYLLKKIRAFFLSIFEF